MICAIRAATSRVHVAFFRRRLTTKPPGPRPRTML